MDQLLKHAIEAHGGLSRWNRLRSLSGNAKIGGALWDMKGSTGVLSDVHLAAALQFQAMTLDLCPFRKRIIFTPGQVSTETEDGVLIDVRNDPRCAYSEHTSESQWDDLHAGYFSAYALWGYLTTPFLYAYPGFEATEVEPWEEEGEVWRVLRVVFPESMATHTRVQHAYFGEDGLLRRHRYTVDILGGTRGVNYASKYVRVDGIMIPTERRVFTSDDQGRKIPEECLISIDLSRLSFS